MHQKKLPNNRGSLLTTFIYFGVCFVIVSVYQFTNFLSYDYLTFIGVDLILSIYTSAFAIYYWRSIKPLLSLKTLNHIPFLYVMVIACLLGSGIFHLLMWLNDIFYNDHFQISLIFWDTAHPLIYSIIFICLQPALFEELAFRGFIFNNLLGKFSVTATFVISALLFAILHLSVISVLWLFPIGLLFAYFRYKYNSLWYGIVGHFCYNCTIILLEFYYMGM